MRMVYLNIFPVPLHLVHVFLLLPSSIEPFPRHNGQVVDALSSSLLPIPQENERDRLVLLYPLTVFIVYIFFHLGVHLAHI